MDMMWYRRRGLMVTPHIESVTGAIASFNSDYNKIPIKSLICDIEPIQEGTGDPSPENVRPISGRTGLTVSHSGADTSNSTTISVNWQTEAGTVYGGMLDVVSGKLAITHIAKSVREFSTWNAFEDSGYTGLRTRYLPLFNNRTSLLCSHYTSVVAGTIAPGQIISGSWFYNLAICDPDHFTTQQELLAFADEQEQSNTPIQICVPIDEVVSTQLTPQEVKALLGENNIWCDSGDASVDYWKWGK